MIENVSNEIIMWFCEAASGLTFSNMIKKRYKITYEFMGLNLINKIYLTEMEENMNKKQMQPPKILRNYFTFSKTNYTVNQKRN